MSTIGPVSAERYGVPCSSYPSCLILPHSTFFNPSLSNQQESGGWRSGLLAFPIWKHWQLGCGSQDPITFVTVHDRLGKRKELEVLRR